MLDADLTPRRFDEAASAWARSFSLKSVKCLIVCRGPVRKEAIEVFDAVGIASYGMLLSEKDSVVYPKCLAPELRNFKYPNNVHRIPEYMGSGQEEKVRRIGEIIEIARTNGYTHVFAGYGFMAEDAEFILAIEQAGLCFLGPSSKVCHAAGAKDEAKKLARSLGNSVTPGVDNVSTLALMRKAENAAGLQALAKKHGLKLATGASVEQTADNLLEAGYAARVELVSIADLQDQARIECERIWKERAGSRIRFKYIGGGGGKGQRVVGAVDEVASAVMDVLAESKVVADGSNRNFLIELNIETTRHNEIQLIGNGDWCLSLGGRDCSVQMHEQKLVEVSLTQELLRDEITRSKGTRARVLEADLETLVRVETEGERFGQAVGLNSVSTFECIVEGTNNYFMEVNTRIQVEHRVTELVYRLKFVNPDDATDVFYVESLVEAMVLLAVHGARVPKPVRVPRHMSGIEVRINATNAALQPHAGGLIASWSSPQPGEVRDDQGIGVRNPDTRAFIHYNLAGAYDSNIALVLAHGQTRRENLERLAQILRATVLRGVDLQTNMPVHYGIIHWMLGKDAMVKPTTRFMTPYLAAVGALQVIAREVDMVAAWEALNAATKDPHGARVLQSKETLLVRPIERLLANPHVLAGFIGRYNGVMWKRSGDKVEFAVNPVVFLERLYHYLNLDADPSKPPSDQIWQHDAAILSGALAFYKRVSELSGKTEWAAVNSLFDADKQDAISGGDKALWQACQASHRGFQVGMELLLVIARIGMRSEFDAIGVDEELNPTFPKVFLDATRTAEFTRALAPPPAASSDEIVAPMGGHFYAREAPTLPPLIDEGDRFEAKQPLFVIEVMKMFNKVLAPFSGRVVENRLKDADGTIVKKGQVIFKIVPDVMLTVEDPKVVADRRRKLTRSLLGLA